MKKIIAVIVSIALLASCALVIAGCGKKPADSGLTGGEAVGGWTKADSPEITEAFKAVFNKATATLAGVEYTPVAYIASQVVAGTNHLVLCKATATVPGAESTYVLLTVWEHPDGAAEITETVETGVSAAFSENDGGWAEPASPAVTDEALTALNKACETLAGVEYAPVALLGTQVVAGVNYRILCEAKATVPGAETEYAILTVYADPQGKAQITDTVEIQREQLAQIANPLEEYGCSADSLAAAEEAVGFTLTFPGDLEAENYIVINGTLLEVRFDGGYLRKEAGSEDISGDYNVYDTEKTVTSGGREITLKGNGDQIHLAIWADGGYTYCVGISDGISEAGMLDYVNAVK
jgi:hypothetical protein